MEVFAIGGVGAKQNAGNGVDFRLPLLSAMMADPGCAARVMGRLSAYRLDEIFEREQLVIAEVVQGLVLRGVLPSVAVVLNALRESGRLGKDVSEEDVYAVAGFVPSSSALDVADVDDWVDVVLEDTRRRLLLRTLREQVAHLEAGAPYDEVQRGIIAQLSRTGGQVDGFKLMVAAVSGLAEASIGWFGGKPVGRVPTGFRELDRRLGGGLPIGLTTVGGRPGMGKSTLLLAMAENIVGRGGRVAFVSLEMSIEDLALRMVCRRAKLDSRKLLGGEYKSNEELRKRFEDALVSIDEGAGGLYVDDTPDLSTDEVLLRLVQFRAQTGAFDAIFVDYAGLIARSGIADEDGASESDRVEMTYKRLRAIARRFGVPIVVASQLNKDVETRANKLPIADDLRYGGAATSDAILLVWYPWKYRAVGVKLTNLPDAVEIPSEDERQARAVALGYKRGAMDAVDLRYWLGERDLWVIVAKVRTGGLQGMVRLDFDAATHSLQDGGIPRRIIEVKEVQNG